MSLDKKQKRRLASSTKLSGEELTRKILLVSIENLVPFERVENTYFRNFIINYNNFDSSTNFIPDSEILLHLSRELYNDLHDYYCHYFSTKSCNASLTFHKWHPPGEIHPYVYINLFYFDESFVLCNISLGLVEMRTNGLANFLVGSVILKCFKEKINFITTNFELDTKTIEILSFIMGEIDITNKILTCLPTILNEVMVGFCDELWDIKVSSQNAEDTIPNMVLGILDNELEKFASISLEELLPLPHDEDSTYFDLLTKWLRKQKSLVLPYLSGLLFYKQSLIGFIQSQKINITESSWDLISFVESIFKPFYDIILSCSSVHPVAHMVLKWLKILIIQVNSVETKTRTMGSSSYELCVAKLNQKLRSIHDDVESKPDLWIASYLHPSTKRYLKEEHLMVINQVVSDLSKTSKHQRINPDCMDDIIMQMFDCSGKATKECYNYETSATSEVKYMKQSPYLTKEAGPHILQFWNKNSEKYVTLSSLARSNLSIQTTSENDLHSFKNCFSELKSDTCDLEVMYFLHGLCKTVDLLSFNPKDMDLDMRGYRFDNEHTSSNSSYIEESDFFNKKLRS